MILSRLIQRMAAVQPVETIGPMETGQIDIHSLHYRAQEVERKGMFIAVRGQNADGHDYIDIALKHGAAAVVTEQPVSMPVPCLLVADTRKALSSAAAEFYNNPSAHLTLVGITGTNGKTTTAFLVESLFQKAGCRTGLMGTIYTRYAGQRRLSPLTTPESLDLQRMLAEMRDRGVTHAVMEASSHAIALSRVDDCWMDVGVFTNLSQDHLDFHGNMDRYRGAKERFFTKVLQTGPKKKQAWSVINCNDPWGAVLRKACPGRCLDVGFDPANTVWADVRRSDLSGIQAAIHTPAGAFEIDSALIGRHNLENILCAAGVGWVLGFSPGTIREGLEAVRRIPGRFDVVPDGAGRHVVIDYAHTPHALENALKAVRDLNPKRIITVFGCGGNRDREKRPLMGEIAGRLSDVIILTSDNPRKEDPDAIIAEIRKGVKHACMEEGDPLKIRDPNRKIFWVEPERRKAIRTGIETARSGDAVLIAGKGHETYQIRRDETVHFDDREEAEAALSLARREQGAS